MNPKTLMIGNLVMCEGKAREVIGLTASSITLDGYDVFESDAQLRLIEPLPITAENLKLAGAVFSSWKWFLNCSIIEVVGNIAFVDANTPIQRSFRSIHKLQNYITEC
jgi:hypothetical protein